MESLLTPSFANLSSREPQRIRKGLRQLEGLLAQICLPSTKSSPNKRKSSVVPQDERTQRKELRELRKDAAFREWFYMQESFKWNFASRLIATLERLMGMHHASQTDALILSTLDLLQGVLLLHPPSRSLFNREDYMNLLLDLLDPSNPATVEGQALLVLVTAMLETPSNTRAFEAMDGLQTVTSLYKSRSTPPDVRARATEFLYFYLMPEGLPTSSSSAPNTQQMPRSPSKANVMAAHARTHSGDGDRMDVDTEMMGPKEKRTTEEKQKLLGRHLNNVAELIRDLGENTTPAVAAG